MTHARWAAPLAAWTCLACWVAPTAWAGSAADVPTPVFEQGAGALGLKLGRARLRAGGLDAEAELSAGFAFSRHWYTEVKGLWAKPPGQRQDFDAWAWENKFLLTEAGKSAFDLALKIEIARPLDRSAGYSLSWGPQLQTRLNPHLQANLNLQFSQAVRTAQGGPTELSYSWQLKHDWRPDVEFGLQGLGELGAWRRCLLCLLCCRLFLLVLLHPLWKELPEGWVPHIVGQRLPCKATLLLGGAADGACRERERDKAGERGGREEGREASRSEYGTWVVAGGRLDTGAHLCSCWLELAAYLSDTAAS